MEKPLQISVLGMDHSESLEQHIRDKVHKLEEVYPRIVGCRVTVEKPHRHHHHGAHSDVRIDLQLPGRVSVVVNRQHGEDVYVALRDAFDSARRQLLARNE
jgi:ribosomal subunit interface protein